MGKTVCEIFLAINDDGEYAVGLDEDSARETLESECGLGNAFRMIKLTIGVRCPQIEQVALDVSDAAGTVEQVTAD